MTDAYPGPLDGDFDDDSLPGVDPQGYGSSANPVQGGSGSTDPLGWRLGQAMKSIVSDPNGLNDFDPSADPWVRQLRGPPRAPDGPGLLDGQAVADPNGGPSTQASATRLQPTAGIDAPFLGPDDPRLDSNLASDGYGQYEDIGSRSATLRRHWSLKHGLPWPTDPVTGRNHDVAHIVAKADGGADTVDNIKPMHPVEHRQQHMANGDFSRWARRRVYGNETLGAAASGEAAALSESALRGLGLLQIIPDITGILSGRIRTDNWNNFMSDMLGVPSQRDMEQWYREHPLET